MPSLISNIKFAVKYSHTKSAASWSLERFVDETADSMRFYRRLWQKAEAWNEEDRERIIRHLENKNLYRQTAIQGLISM